MSLPISRDADRDETGDRFCRAGCWRTLAGGRDVLALLCALGVNAVETPVGAETEGSALARHLRLCQEAGLVVSLHPYREETGANPAYFAPDAGDGCAALRTGFLAVAAEAALRQHVPTICKRARSRCTGRPSPARPSLASVRSFQWAREWCEKNAPDVARFLSSRLRPTLASRSSVSPTITPSCSSQCRPQRSWRMFGILAMRFSNSQRFGTELDPPPELLGRILHVHCHDVDASDHRPLIYGNVPWQRFLGQLVDSGFDGTVVLEVLPDAFLAMGGLAALERSISALFSFRR